MLWSCCQTHNQNSVKNQTASSLLALVKKNAYHDNFSLELRMLAIVKHLVVLDVLDDLADLLHEEGIVLFQVAAESHQLLPEVFEFRVCCLDLHHEVV